MTNTTDTQTTALSAVEAYYAAAEAVAVSKYNVPAHIAREAFAELRKIGPALTLNERTLTAANRAVFTTGTSIHPKALADIMIGSFRDAR